MNVNTWLDKLILSYTVLEFICFYWVYLIVFCLWFNLFIYFCFGGFIL